MTLARTLYKRFQQLIHEFAKFGVIGVIGLFITNFCYDLLHNQFGMGPVTSTTIATLVATAFAYVGNRYWSFRHRERTGLVRESVIFFMLNGFGLLIQDAAVGFNYYVAGSHDKFSGFVALNVGIALATAFRFWSYRKWVWLAPAAAAPAPPAAKTAATPAPAGQQAVTRNGAHAAGPRHANGYALGEQAARSGSPLSR